LTTERIELLFELADAVLQVVLLLRQAPHLSVASHAVAHALRLLEPLADLAFLIGQRLRLTSGIARRFGGLIRLRLVHQTLRLLKRIGRLTCLRAAVGTVR
jgi:hypothetical protein